MLKPNRCLSIILASLFAAASQAEIIKFNNIEFDATSWGDAASKRTPEGLKISPTKGKAGDAIWGNCVITLEPGIRWDEVTGIRFSASGTGTFDVRIRFLSDASRGYVPSVVVDKFTVDGNSIQVEIPPEILKTRAAEGDLPDAIVVGVGADLGNTAGKNSVTIGDLEVTGAGLKAPAHESAKTTEEWLEAMQDPVTGLVRSYGSEWNCFAYDQGAWAVAQCALGKRQQVEKLFGALQKLQEPSGLIRAGYNWKTARNNFDQPSPGQMAWIGLGLNAYTIRYDDRRFVPMAEKLANYLMSQQDADGGIVGVNGNVPWDRDGDFSNFMIWKSTEETMDTFSFLYHLGQITGKQTYTDAALKARDFVRSMWDESQGMFRQGIQRWKHEKEYRNDMRFPGDVQYWVIMSVGPKGEKDQLYVKSLDKVEELLGVKDGQLQGISYSEEYALKYPGCIWWDQTFSLAAAFHSVGDTERHTKYLTDGEKAMTANGAFPLTTSGEVPKPVWPLMPHTSVAATSWYIFAKHHINPFHPATPAPDAGK